MNEKIKLFTAIADAAISDAARWKKESDLWKLKYETLNEKVLQMSTDKKFN